MDLLVDADILACQFAYAYESSRDGTNTYSDIKETDISDAEWAISGFDSAIKRMINQTKTKDAILCFTGCNNFRYSILPTYKSNRKGKPKPMLLDILMEHAWAKWNCKRIESLEADDIMGIMATDSPGSYIIATIDKDLKQIPGFHYDWRKDEVKTIRHPEADYWFYYQVLTGDSTDGYRGCPGIGVVRAKTVLKGVKFGKVKSLKKNNSDLKDHLWIRVVRAFESKGLTEEDALIQARVARILRTSDYDFIEREPILWCPNEV